MPLINTFLWISLLLVLLLGLQLVNAYNRAERSAYQRYARLCRNDRSRTPVRMRDADLQADYSMKMSGFLTVGQAEAAQGHTAVSYLLPPQYSATGSDSGQKMAAVSDCQSCA